MKRSEFCENVTDLSDAMWFISDNGLYDFFDDIIDSYTADDYINDDIENFDGGWTDLRDYLNDIGDLDGYDYVRCRGSFSYEGLTDDDARYIIDDICEIMDNNSYWDPEDDEEDLELDEELIEEELQEEEDGPEDNPDFNGLYTACSGVVNVLRSDEEKREHDSYMEFTGIIHGFIK